MTTRPHCRIGGLALVVLLTATGMESGVAAQDVPQPQPQPQPQFTFDPGILTSYFNLGPAQIEMKEFKDPTGRITPLPYVTFLVEAKTSFTAAGAIFFGHYYDADGIELYNSPVEFEPLPQSWTPGTRSRAAIQLPPESLLPRVRLLVVKDLYGS